MPNILKVSKEEVTWQLSFSNINAGAQANARIKEYLEEDSVYFAPISTTTNGYIWTSTESEWTPLASADSIQRGKIDAELSSLRNRVREKLSTRSKLAEEILSLPSDDGKYIFFKDEVNGIRILIAGWGFSNARRKVVMPRKEVKEKTNLISVKVGFEIDGKIQPFHKFLLTTHGGSQKECCTEQDGYLSLGEQKKGTMIQVQDVDSAKSFTFEIEEGRSEYVLDVTRFTNVVISAVKDKSPLPNETIVVKYCGAEHVLTTDNNGQAKLSVVYIATGTISALCNNNEITTNCEYPNTNINFDFVSPAPKEKEVIPPPIKLTYGLKVRCINQHGSTLPNYPLTITINEKTEDLVTSVDGTISIDNLMAGTYVMVKDGYTDENPVAHTIVCGENLLDYIVKESKEEIVNNLQIIGINGQPVCNQKIMLIQDGKSLVLRLDDSGNTQFPANKFENNKDITVSILSKDSDQENMTFTTDIDERDYLIQQNLCVKNPWWKKLLNIVIAILLIIAMIELGAIFVQLLPR